MKMRRLMLVSSSCVEYSYATDDLSTLLHKKFASILRMKINFY